jgi:hypothetical protein
MPQIFVNPNLPNYFLSATEVVAGSNIRSYVDEYESPKVVVFPNLKTNVDFEFWSNVDRFPIKKLRARVDPKNFDNDILEGRQLADSGIGSGMRKEIGRQASRFLESIIPAYLQIFKGYEFVSMHAVWRLTATLNENMHVDTYKQPYEHHLARMFINIDTQPRIWQTSWTIDEIVKMQSATLSRDFVRTASANDLWAELNRRTFGKSSREWWDAHPRHVIYFDPGDVWIVDSRQIAHQIFYGRRAISIDFFVSERSMKNCGKQYLRFTENLRQSILAEAN